MSRHLFFTGELNSSNEFPVSQIKIDNSFNFKNLHLVRIVVKGLKISGTAPDCIPSATHFHLVVGGPGNAQLGNANFIVRSLDDNLPGWPVPMGNEKFLDVEYRAPIAIVHSDVPIHIPILNLSLVNENGSLLNTTTELTNGATYAVWLIASD